MNPTRDGFKVVDTEAVRKIVTVVAHHVKRMAGIDHRMEDALLTDFDFKGTYLVVGFQLGGEFIVPFAVGECSNNCPNQLR